MVRNIMLASLLVALLAACSSHACNTAESDEAHLITDDKRPWFCRGKDCPEFKLEEKREDYEIRTYRSGYWVTTNVTGSKFEIAMGRAFTSLYRYFNGANEKHEKASLTTPYVTMLEVKKHGEATEKNYTISLPVPDKFQDDPPKPTSDTLDLFKLPEETVYVRNVSGFATEGTFLEEREKMIDALENDHQKFNSNVFFAAVYDPPQRLTGRYNEVWVGKKSSHHHVETA